MDALLDQAPCGYASFDDAGVLTAVNRTLAAMLGAPPEALVGAHVETLLTVAGRIFYQTHFFPLLKLHGTAEEIFLSLRARDGTDVPVLVHATRREEAGNWRNHCVFVSVSHRRKYEDEILAAKHRAEEALRSNEELVRTRQALEQQARELDRKVSRLEQQNAELTRFSTILSHDLREPIRKLAVFADILSKEPPPETTPMAAKAVEVIRTESRRLSTLVRGLYAYASLSATSEPLARVELGAVLDAARTVMAQRYGEGALDVAAAALPAVEGYRRQLETLFVHLLDNAVQFGTPGVAPRVVIEGREVQENSYRATEGRYRYVDCVLLTFEDNGIGFEERFANYVFEALRKLDPATPGLGLGLAIARKVAENHFGWIRAESTVGLGSRFTVMLPVQQ